jgi:tetratricopeptide (TPR) repeat protein
MKKTYLIELLSKLSLKQMKELHEFIRSPFFNKNESVTGLFDYLRLHYPDFSDAAVKKETVHKKLFHSAEFNDNFMRSLIFKLTQLTEEYLAYSEFKNKPIEEKKILTDVLLNFGMDPDAQKQIKGIEKDLDCEVLQSADYFRNKYEVEKLKDVIYSRTYKPVTVKDKPGESLLEESNNLTAYYLISILRRYRYLLNKSYTVNAEFETDFLEGILHFLKSSGKKYLENLTINLLYSQMLVLTDPTREGLIHKLINDLTNDKLPIEDEERREGLTVLANICIEKGYEGKEKYFSIILEIDRYLVSKNLYNRVKGGYFENEMFTNIVTIGLKLNEVEWVKKFIEENYRKLSPDSVNNRYNYSYAKVYFKIGDFEKAKEYIDKVEYSDLYMKVNARISQVVILYELNKFEDIYTSIDNFKKYIQNDKLLSRGHKKICSNFIKLILSLCKTKYSHNENLIELKKQISEVDQVSHREWLLRKTEDLIRLRKK